MGSAYGFDLPLVVDLNPDFVAAGKTPNPPPVSHSVDENEAEASLPKWARATPPEGRTAISHDKPGGTGEPGDLHFGR